MTYFVRAGYEQNSADTLTDAAGAAFRLDAGDGINYTAGASYAIGDSFNLQGLLVGTWRDETTRSDLAVPQPFSRSLDFRPGYTWTPGDFVITQQLSFAVTGANVLAPEGILTTVEVRF